MPIAAVPFEIVSLLSVATIVSVPSTDVVVDRRHREADRAAVVGRASKVSVEPDRVTPVGNAAASQRRQQRRRVVGPARGAARGGKVDRRRVAGLEREAARADREGRRLRGLLADRSPASAAMLKLIASSISVMVTVSEAVVIDAVPFEIVCVAQRRNDRLGALDRCRR